MALEQLRRQAATENVRITQHAHQEMVEEEISLNELLEAIVNGQVLENYPEHRRGACCLINGTTNQWTSTPHCVYNGIASFNHHYGVRAKTT